MKLIKTNVKELKEIIKQGDVKILISGRYGYYICNCSAYHWGDNDYSYSLQSPNCNWYFDDLIDYDLYLLPNKWE